MDKGETGRFPSFPPVTGAAAWPSGVPFVPVGQPVSGWAWKNAHMISLAEIEWVL